ncbi:hypothetical protein FB446DRAFT_457022 [Lentinula raphanica]|nr:hypothetical protein FB446DRAFT_457022 [Lentinula raphanica]
MRLNTKSVLYALVCLSAILHTACGSPLPTPDVVIPISSAAPGPSLSIHYSFQHPGAAVLRVLSHHPVKGINELLYNYILAGFDHFHTALGYTVAHIHFDYVTDNKGTDPVPHFFDYYFEELGLWEFQYHITFSSQPSDTVSNIGIWGDAYLTIFVDPNFPTKPVDRVMGSMKMELKKCDGLKSRGKCPDVPRIGPLYASLGDHSILAFSEPEPKSKPFAVGKVVETVMGKPEAGKVVDEQHGWWKSLSALKDHVIGS